MTTPLVRRIRIARETAGAGAPGAGDTAYPITPPYRYTDTEPPPPWNGIPEWVRRARRARDADGDLGAADRADRP